jgi:long-chain acyl-CoA synthetase
VLSHANLIANAAGSAALMAQQCAWGPGDAHLSFLPLAHIFERKNLTLALHFGLAVGFYSGDARKVFEDAAAVQPSLFMAVPRVFNRLHDEVMAEVAKGSALRRRLFHAAYSYKVAALEAGRWRLQMAYSSVRSEQCAVKALGKSTVVCSRAPRRTAVLP